MKSNFAKKKIRVFVVDDSLLMRKVISDVLSEDPQIEVVGNATDGRTALTKIQSLKPDVITMDVEMPLMDGIQCVREIMNTNPIPVVMVSSITYEGGFKTLEALEAGAFDYVQKPMAQEASSIRTVGALLISKIKMAIDSPRFRENLRSTVKPLLDEDATLSPPPKLKSVLNFSDHLIAIGISTGGPPCLNKIFEALPESSPPVVVVQHMPEGFTKAMAERINKVSAMAVKEAVDGDQILKGKGFIAPGNAHMRVKKEAGGFRIRIQKDEPVSGHRPSVDVLFESVAEAYSSKAIGVIMTGMGRDGVTQMKNLKQKGAHTIAQDEKTCTVFGMPKIAIQENAQDEILSLNAIVQRLCQIARKTK